MSAPVKSSGVGRKLQDRYLWLTLCVAVAFLVLLGRLWYLQILHGDEYYRAATNNIIRTVDKKAPRGRIFDRNATILADNRASFDVYLLPRIHRPKTSEDEPLQLLKSYLNLSIGATDRIVEKSSARPGEILVARDISRRQVALIESDRLRLPGVEIRPEFHRFYPLQSNSAHTIGFVGEVTSKEQDMLAEFAYRSGDYIGRMGVERSFEAVLRGSPGVSRTVVDARGIPQGEAETRFLIGDYQNVQPVPGRDVILTIDANLQLLIEQEVKNYPSAAVVALDSQDGSILAMYSKPSFNPNSWSGRLSSIEKRRSDRDPFKPMLDKTVSSYFPGSTYKVVGAVAALEKGAMSPEDEVTCTGSYKFGGRRFRCWKRGGHGKVNLAEALAFSCDVYFYKVAEALGIDVLAEYGYEFGFGEAAGYPVNHESAGRVPTKEWHKKHSPEGYQHGFSLNTVIGQGDTLSTPLQVALAYAAIANGGKLYHPRLVSEIRTPDGALLFEFPAKVRKTIKSDPESLKAVRDGLELTTSVDGGTAYKYKLDVVSVAGKTGTAQVHKIGKVRIANRDKAIKLRDHAWFASYAPVEAPQIALVVLLEHGGHGGSDAAPVAMRILDRYFKSDESLLTRKLPATMRAHEPSTLEEILDAEFEDAGSREVSLEENSEPEVSDE